MSKRAKWIIAVLIILLIITAVAVFAILGYVQPYRQAENSMPDIGTMILCQQENGALQLTWPDGVNCDRYLLQILRPAEAAFTSDDLQVSTTAAAEDEILYSVFVTDTTEYTLPNFPKDELITIRVSTAKGYDFPFEKEERIRFGEQYMQITGVFQPPAISNLTWTSDANAKQVYVRFDLDENSTCRMYYMDNNGQLTLLDSLTEGQVTISFGDDQQFCMPGFHEQHTFAFDVYSEFDGFVYYGAVTDQFSVVREDLLGTELMLNCTDEGNNVFSFTWNETKGERYELQQYDEEVGIWTTIYEVPRDGERSYTTGHLPRYSDFKFRVIALGGQTLPNSEFAAVPDEVEVSTGASLIYSTIWPIQDLEIYSTPNKSQVIGTAPGAQAYCVLDQVDGLFYIRFEDGSGYIDSNYCMINLPDFIGDLCLYDITNSYSSLYKAHGYEIPTVTDEVIGGYEYVRTANDDFLVPLLYPTALKLEQAAFAAIDQGYKLKIYDSFRPQKATKALYDQAITLSNEPIPELNTSGQKAEDLPALKEGQVMTYEILMTDNGRYTMNYFLAAGGSRHNQGVAMDLTLVSLYNGQELEMQTEMHDLSWYSELKRNNSSAYTLSGIMETAGFTGLISEWWHFQDDDSKNELNLPYLWNGVNPEGWMADDNGWRYRSAYGEYYSDCTEIINDVEYTFDIYGYVEASDN